jgi:arylformamidase
MPVRDASDESESLIDISVVVTDTTPVWPGDTPWSCRWTWEVARGDSVNVSCTSGSPHVGTHADAPFHIDAGWQASDTLPLESFTGLATVVDVSELDGPLTLESLGVSGRVAGGRLLLRTGRCIAGASFPKEWPWIAEDAIRALLADGLRLLGVDAPSVDGRESTSLSVHRALFQGGACILENLDLRSASPGDYHLTAFPLKVAGLDAAPVRAVLRRLTPA